MKRILSVLITVAFISVQWGCATVEEHKGAATGAAVGAAAGAVGGAVLGKSKTEAAIIGGLLGALVGGAIGHYAYDVKRTRKETEERYSDRPPAETMIRIEDASAVPDTVKPGDKIELNVTYALLGASPESAIGVTEIREIRHESELVGRPEVKITRGGGTYTSNVPLYLPSGSKKGLYTVITTIETENAKDSRQTSFQVD